MITITHENSGTPHTLTSFKWQSICKKYTLLVLKIGTLPHVTIKP